MTCQAPVYAASDIENQTLQYLAQYVHTQTGIPVSVILAQVIIETSYNGAPLNSPLWKECLNPAGIGYTQGNCGGGYYGYTSVQAAAQGYANFYLNDPAGYYANVLQLSRQGASILSICRALGQSPWAGGHYVGCDGIEGDMLYEVITANNLTRFDTSASHQTSAPPGPNCSAQTLAALGSYVGSGSAAGVEAGLYVFQRAANGSIINTVVNDACQVVAVYPHGGSTSATVPVPSAPSIITKIVQSVNWWYVAGIGVAIGIAGLYTVEKTGVAKKYRWW